jgi:hypothetical protein
MHLPGRNLDFRFSFSPERSSTARSALEQLFGDGIFGDGSLAQPEKIFTITKIKIRNHLNYTDSFQKEQSRRIMYEKRTNNSDRGRSCTVFSSCELNVDILHMVTTEKN